MAPPSAVVDNQPTRQGPQGATLPAPRRKKINLACNIFNFHSFLGGVFFVFSAFRNGSLLDTHRASWYHRAEFSPRGHGLSFVQKNDKNDVLCIVTYCMKSPCFGVFSSPAKMGDHAQDIAESVVSLYSDCAVGATALGGR
jgi:hypothetical protein